MTSMRTNEHAHNIMPHPWCPFLKKTAAPPQRNNSIPMKESQVSPTLSFLFNFPISIYIYKRQKIDA